LQIRYLLIPYRTILLEKITGFQPIKEFPEFYGTRSFITSFTSSRQLFLSWASSIQSIHSYPTSWISILILSSYLRQDLPSVLFHTVFITKILYTPLQSPYALHALPNPFFSSLSPEQYWVSSSDHSASHYASSSPLLLPFHS